MPSVAKESRRLGAAKKKKSARRRVGNKKNTPPNVVAFARTAGPVDSDFFRPLRLKLNEGSGGVEDPYRRHPWIHAAIRRIATNIAGVPFRILQESGTDDRDRKAFKSLCSENKSIPDWLPDIHKKASARAYAREIRRYAPAASLGLLCRASGIEVVEDGEWYDLFRDVNPTMTRSMLWESTCVYLHVGGESYWILQKNGNPIANPAETPSEMWVVGAKDMELTIDPKTKTVSEYIYKYKTSSGGQKKVTLKPHQVVPFRFFDPKNPMRGLGPYQPLALDVGVDHKASIFNQTLLDNGALPSGVLTTDRPMSPTQVQEVLDEWEARHQGAPRSNRPAVLWGGMKWEQSRLTHNEMQFHQLREWVRDSVMAVMGVPKSQLGIIQDVNRATALQSQKMFWQETLVPLMHYIEDTIHSHLFSPQRSDLTTEKTQGPKIWGEFDLSSVEALRQEIGEKLDSAKKLFSMGYPPNMINDRLDLGMEDVKWGDDGYLSIGLMSVNQPHPMIQQDKDDDLDDDEKVEPEPDKDQDEGDDLGEGPGGGSVDSKIWTRIAETTFAPGEAKLKSKFRRYLFDLASEQFRILDAADMNFIVMAEQLLFPLPAWQKRVVSLFTPIYKEIYERAVIEADAEVVGIFSDMKLSVERDVDDDPEIGLFFILTNQRIQKSVATIRRALLKTIREGLEIGATKDEIKKRLKLAFKVFRSKTGTIARTETSSIVNGARDQVFKRRRVAYFEWVTAADELVRINHRLYGAGGKRERGFNWAELSGGAYTLERPLDFRAPPEETINCRCVLAPALP